MPILYERKSPPGYYIKTSRSDNKITYQIRAEGEAILRSFGLLVSEKKLSHETLYLMRMLDMIYTNASGTTPSPGGAIFEPSEDWMPVSEARLIEKLRSYLKNRTSPVKGQSSQSASKPGVIPTGTLARPDDTNLKPELKLINMSGRTVHLPGAKVITPQKQGKERSVGNAARPAPVSKTPPRPTVTGPLHRPKSQKQPQSKQQAGTAKELAGRLATSIIELCEIYQLNLNALGSAGNPNTSGKWPASLSHATLGSFKTLVLHGGAQGEPAYHLLFGCSIPTSNGTAVELPAEKMTAALRCLNEIAARLLAHHKAMEEAGHVALVHLNEISATIPSLRRPG